jgi:hypothetical protein
MPSALRRQVYQRAQESLKPHGIAIIEAYHPSQVGYSTGGPKDEDLLVTLQNLRDQWAGCDCLIGRELVREVNEGVRHTGAAAVTQAVFRKTAQIPSPEGAN